MYPYFKKIVKKKERYELKHVLLCFVLIWNRIVLENRTVHSDALRRSSTSDGEIMSKTILEAELRELRERYSMMSLKYAEVEAQREELVMKLRTTSRNSSKRWFS